MEQTDIVEQITTILSRIIDDHVDEFEENSTFRVAPGYGDDSFDLDCIDVGSDKSLPLLIHTIMYDEGIYEEFLNEEEFEAVENLVSRDDSVIYSPDDDDALQEFLDEIYFECIQFVAHTLTAAGFDVEEEFIDYMWDQPHALLKDVALQPAASDEAAEQIHQAVGCP